MNQAVSDLSKVVVDNAILQEDENSSLQRRLFSQIDNDVITKQLNTFVSYSLDELNQSSLMDRVDTKFLLPISYLATLLAELTPFYRVLEINSKRVMSYRNFYLDSANFKFYNDHHNGKANRFKVRQRCYVDSGSKFLEVKFKNNKKRTVKTRVELRGRGDDSNAIHAFIESNTGLAANRLNISLKSGYQRISFASKTNEERLTLDFNLWFQSPDEQLATRYQSFFVAELKQKKKSKESRFYQLMSSNKHFPISFSKYCIGCASVYGSKLKVNQFKATLVQIEKMAGM